MYRYITNPKTNESYDITSTKGLKLMKEYVNQIGGKCSKCNKEFNEYCFHYSNLILFPL